MMILLSFFCSLVLCLTLVMGFRLRYILRVQPPSRESEAGVERSPDFYRPMDRLLAETDFQFLRSRPEIPHASIDRMRKDRRRVFRKYLSCLAVDFAAITAEIRMVMLDSANSRDDLVQVLLRARLIFAVSILAIEARLLLHACGIYSVSISAAHLTAGLANMQRELRQLGPAAVFSV